MLKPAVSLLMTSHNDAAYIGQTLQHVFNQTFPKDKTEILIAHDYSTDHSAEIIQDWITASQPFYRHHIQLSHHYHDDNNTRRATGGPAPLRNEMILRSQGDIIVTLDGDDAWHPDKVARQVDVLSRDAAFCSVGYEWVTADDQKLNVTMALPSRFYGYEELLKQPVLINSAAAWDSRKTGVLQYPEGTAYRGWEDQAFYAQYLSAGNQVYCIQDVLMQYRVLPKSTSAIYSLAMRPIGTAENHERMAACYDGDRKQLFAEASRFLHERCNDWPTLQAKIGTQPV